MSRTRGFSGSATMLKGQVGSELVEQYLTGDTSNVVEKSLLQPITGRIL